MTLIECIKNATITTEKVIRPISENIPMKFVGIGVYFIILTACVVCCIEGIKEHRDPNVIENQTVGIFIFGVIAVILIIVPVLDVLGVDI